MIIRGLALGEIKAKDYFKVLWKEIRVSLFVGLVLGAVNVVRMLVMKLMFGNEVSYSVIIVASLSVWAVVVVAKMLGCTLPIIAKLLKLDPALMSGPMISTIVDAISLLIYFYLATVFIKF